MDEGLRVAPDVTHEALAASERATAFEEFVVREHGRLYGALCLITRDRNEAEDLAQEALLKVWERWDRIRDMGDPVSYLYRTALNLHRKRARRARVAIRRAVGVGVGRDGLIDVEIRDQVVRALGRLTPRQRVSIVLTDLLDYPSEEAARLMGIKAATVRVLASQARAALRRNAGEADE
jgi:RNA polymerase sigma factor (sigma-70 family)